MSRDIVKICVGGTEAALFELCRVALRELAAENCELIASPNQSDVPQADAYIWDFQPEAFPNHLGPQKIEQSLFVIDPKLLDQFREFVGRQNASVLLKPFQASALHPFLKHSICQFRPVAEEPRPADEQRDLLDCLLHATMRLQKYDDTQAGLLARAVHDLQAPLTALSGYCGLLISERLGPLNSEQVDLLCRMQHSLKRVSRLAEAMFELSEAPHGVETSDLKPGDVEACIGQAIQEITQQAEEKQIQVAVSVENPERPLLFDSVRIEQVLVNLLENACKFTPKRGTIEVSGYPVSWNRHASRIPIKSASNGNHVAPVQTDAYRIDVRDSGTAIAAEDVESVFEEQTSGANGNDRSGGGLGLAICRMIVEQHGGNIWAESGGGGTQFSFVIPHVVRSYEPGEVTPYRARAVPA